MQANHAFPGRNAMKVIYIAGTSHSGSTLLDLMLNAHPAIISVGEILKLNRQLKPRGDKGRYVPCSCVAPSLWQCPFWSRVNDHVEQSHGKSLVDFDVQGYGELDEAPAPNVAVFEAIAEVAGKKIVVDSSKMPRRLSHLMQLAALDVFPIHLIRSPKGQIFSVMRKHGGFLGHLVRYELVHEQVRRKLRSVPHTVVRYEDLVRHPEATLRAILTPLGLTFHPRQLAWAEAEKHLVAGNHLRRQSSSELVLDDKWERGLSAAQKLAIDLGTLRSRRLFARTGHVSDG